MKRVFELEFDDDLGPMWMNEDNLASCLFSETHISNVKVGIKDITDDELEGQAEEPPCVCSCTPHKYCKIHGGGKPPSA